MAEYDMLDQLERERASWRRGSNIVAGIVLLALLVIPLWYTVRGYRAATAAHRQGIMMKIEAELRGYHYELRPRTDERGGVMQYEIHEFNRLQHRLVNSRPGPGPMGFFFALGTEIFQVLHDG